MLLSVSTLSQERTTHLLEWRAERLKNLLARDLSIDLHRYLRWEATWVRLWIDEADLTARLQRGFLDEVSQSEQKQILKELLRLRVKAEHTAFSQDLEALDTLAKERLTVLARTAEQLMRLDEHKSQGAFVRVRRLSRELDKITERFQADRLEALERRLSSN